MSQLVGHQFSFPTYETLGRTLRPAHVSSSPIRTSYRNFHVCHFDARRAY
jgi:hypothetical protein